MIQTIGRIYNKVTLYIISHCPWVSGCVGFKNYKFFFLFVLYTGCYGLWVFVSSLPLVIKGIKDMVSTKYCFIRDIVLSCSFI